MSLARFRFRDHVENGEQFESETSSELSSVWGDGGEESDPESMTGKGIKRLCAELLELKTASEEEFHKSVYADYSAFLRIFEEARAVKSVVTNLRDNLVNEKRLVNNLADGIYLKFLSKETIEGIIEAEFDEELCFVSKLEAHTDDVLEILDTLLYEQRLEEALTVLEIEEVAVQNILSEDVPDVDVLAFYNYSVLGRKGMLAKKFSVLAENPRVNGAELQRALIGLCRLEERQLATQLLLRHYHLRMAKGIQRLQSSKSHLNELYVKELSKFVFSTISQSAKCFVAVHGETSPFTSELIEWAHEETAVYAACFSKYLESVSETGGGLSTATESVRIAMIFCTLLECQRLELQPCMMKHIRPALEKVLEAQIRHFKRVIGIFTSSDHWDLSRYLTSRVLSEGFHLAITGEDELEYCFLTSSGKKFITLLQAIIEDVDLLFTLGMGNFIFEGLVNLFTEYLSILAGAMTMRSTAAVLEKGGSVDNIPESLLQQVSILLNISAVEQFFSSFLTSLIHNTRSTNVETSTSSAVDCQEKQLEKYIIRVQDTSGQIRILFYQRFIYLPVENKQLGITGSCIDEAYRSAVDYDLPTLKFQVLFLELRKLEDFSEENAIEDGWLMKLLADLMKAVFVSMPDDRDRLMVIREVGNYKQMILLDIQFMVEIARFEGCLSEDLLIASSTLVTQLESTALSSGLVPDTDRELTNGQWAAWARNSATKSIQMLLEIHMAKSTSDEREMQSPEEPQKEDSCLEDDDTSSLSEESEKLEENLEMGVEQVVITAEQLSLTRPSVMDDDRTLNMHLIYHSDIGRGISSGLKSEPDPDNSELTLDESLTLPGICGNYDGATEENGSTPHFLHNWEKQLVASKQHSNHRKHAHQL